MFEFFSSQLQVDVELILPTTKVTVVRIIAGFSAIFGGMNTGKTSVQRTEI
jgi:hypothetical protein